MVVLRGALERAQVVSFKFKSMIRDNNVIQNTQKVVKDPCKYGYKGWPCCSCFHSLSLLVLFSCLVRLSFCFLCFLSTCALRFLLSIIWGRENFAFAQITSFTFSLLYFTLALLGLVLFCSGLLCYAFCFALFILLCSV